MRFVKYLALSAALLCGTAEAGEWLVQNGTIISVAPVADNQDKFYAIVEGGTGPCANGTIQFPRSAFPDENSHIRVFSTLLTAMTVGNKVNIHNYVDAQCTNAGFILLNKP